MRRSIGGFSDSVEVRRLVAGVFLAVAAVLPASPAGSTCPNLVDCRIQEDTGGIWTVARSPEFPAVLIGLTAGGAVWQGDGTRLGRTLWQSLDAAAVSGAATFAVKCIFQRARPRQSTDPNEWFSGLSHQSFPSGDVSSVAALVTPVVLEYGPGSWLIYGLVAIPVFDMVARTKRRAHWWTDVLAGSAVGAGSGWLAHSLSSPLIVRLLPEGFRVGLTREF